MTELDTRIAEFNLLINDKKIKKVLLMLNELKKEGDDFDYAFSYINSNKNNVSINLINSLFKVISEAIIYQHYLISKAKEQLNDNIKLKLDSYRKEENNEREEDLKNLENILEY